MPEYTIKQTFVTRQPSTDFIVILHPQDMKQLKIRTDDYVNLKNTIHNKDETIDLEIFAQVISSEHKLSKMNQHSKESLKPGEIGVDQTCREALGLSIGNKVNVSKTKKRHDFMENLLSKLDFQKSIVRVRQTRHTWNTRLQ